MPSLGPAGLLAILLLSVGVVGAIVWRKGRRTPS